MKSVLGLVFGLVLSTGTLLSTANSAYADQSADQSYNNGPAYEVLEKAAELRRLIENADKYGYSQSKCEHLYDLWELLLNFLESPGAFGIDPFWGKQIERLAQQAMQVHQELGCS